MDANESEYMKGVQTRTGWSRTLHGFAEWCAPQPGCRVLDVGCGPGLLPLVFSQMGCRSFGIDYDMGMFRPAPLHPSIAVANVYYLPFSEEVFDLITVTNLVFLLAEPVRALIEMSRLILKGGRLAMLNPSERLDEQAVLAYSSEKGLDDATRDTLLTWARRASDNHRWSESETADLYHQAGLSFWGSVLKVGPGFGRFSWGSR